MGQGQSEGTANGGDSASLKGLSSVEGFQLVRLIPHSPAYNAGLTPYFDIITALDQRLLQSETVAPFQFFRDYIAKHKDTSVCFTVFNLRIRAFRDVHIVPSESWGGGGILGCSIEWAHAEQCVQRCWHIIEVLEGSPASYCPDIHAERDYIIGMQHPEEQLVSLFKSENDFHTRLEMWQALQFSIVEQCRRFPGEAAEIPHNILLLLYDAEENAVKEVLVEVGTEPGTPLGVNVACGLLHIIPSVVPGGPSSLPVMNRFYLRSSHIMKPSILSVTQQQRQLPPPSFPTPPVQEHEARDKPTTPCLHDGLSVASGGALGTLPDSPATLPPSPPSQHPPRAQSGAAAAPPTFNPFADGTGPSAAPPGLAAASRPEPHRYPPQYQAAPPSASSDAPPLAYGPQAMFSPQQQQQTVQPPHLAAVRPVAAAPPAIPPPLAFPSVFIVPTSRQ